VDIEPYLSRWRLLPDGEPTATRTGLLLPVLRDGVPAILKVASEREERWGAGLMVWWAGEGAAAVLAQEGDALLMERASGEASLAEMVLDAQDDQATEILCRVAARLHAPRSRPEPELLPLVRWFERLAPGAAEHGGILARAAAIAAGLLAGQRDVVVLHGDLHHGNILDFGRRGWLAIDPKRLHGERTFDFVNILRNPSADIALSPGRFDRQVEVITRVAKLDRTRLLEWTLAFCGLSAVWILDDGERPELDLAVAELAAEALDKG
jgi:streptomycin 6-kinase